MNDNPVRSLQQPPTQDDQDVVKEQSQDTSNPLSAQPTKNNLVVDHNVHVDSYKTKVFSKWTTADLHSWLLELNDGQFKNYANLFTKFNGNTFAKLPKDQILDRLQDKDDTDMLFNEKEELIKQELATGGC